MRFDKRLVKLERRAQGRPRADQFTLIVAVPADADRAQGKPPGLYPTGSPGSTTGLLVFDPTRGKPVVPEGKLAPWGLLIRHGAKLVEPPAELPGYDEPQVA